MNCKFVMAQVLLLNLKIGKVCSSKGFWLIATLPHLVPYFHTSFAHFGYFTKFKRFSLESVYISTLLTLNYGEAVSFAKVNLFV